MRKLIVLLLCFGGLSAKAQIPQPDPDTTAKHFLIVASIGNLQEISAAKLALQKARNAEVRSFAQMMVKDHNQAQQQLLQLAKSKGIMLPAAATDGIKPDLMLMKSGDHFDKAYVHAMASVHGNTVTFFENYATVGKNPDVKTFAQQMLPTLKHHLMDVKMLDKKLN